MQTNFDNFLISRWFNILDNDCDRLTILIYDWINFKILFSFNYYLALITIIIQKLMFEH